MKTNRTTANIPSQAGRRVVITGSNSGIGFEAALALARKGRPDASFSFLSGSGADPTGRGRMAFARYKGEAEKAPLASGFLPVYIFRPAYIYPVEPRKEPNFSYRLLRSVYPVFQLLFPNQVIRADDLAKVDIAIRRGAGTERVILENRDIRTLVDPNAP